MKRIAVIGTGGTISNAGTGSLDYLSYLDSGQVLSTEDVVAMNPQIRDVAEILSVPFGQLRSKRLSTADWFRLAGMAQQTLDEDDVDGLVITHGTGLLEETAFFLHLVLDTEKPVVIVGSQRPPRTLSSDAQLNFVDAVRTAAAGQTSGLGVVVVMDQTVHSARDVTKRSNHRLDALTSPVVGPVGVITADGSVRISRVPAQLHTSNSAFARCWEQTCRDHQSDAPLPRVDIVYGHGQADGVAVRAFVEAGAAGLIAIGFPPGTNTPGIDEALDRAIASGVVVVQATRAFDDPRVLSRTSLGDRKLVPNSDLSPQHARILLQLCLAHDFDPEAIEQAFATY